jgi:hypothetical protein
MKRINHFIVSGAFCAILIGLIFILDGCSGCSRSRRINSEQTIDESNGESDSTQTETDEAGNKISDETINESELTAHPSTSNSVRVVSLNKLRDELISNPKSEEATNMFGLGWLEGYVIDSVENDVLLYGRELENWPGLKLTDFIENLRNVVNKEQPPYCSLDPVQQNVVRLNNYLKNRESASDSYKIKELLGEQVAVIGGIPAKSRHAKIMLDADYHMKKVSQGIIRLPDIPSCLDMAVNNFGEIGWSRFWFNNADNSPKYVGNSNILEIAECKIVVSTRGMSSTNSGDLFDSNVENPVANSFARNFSKNFLKSAQIVHVYADLENLFRLQAVLRAMDKNGVLESNGSLFNYYLNEYPYSITYDIPDSYPGLVNELQSVNGDLTVVVMGGVSMEAKEPVWNFQSSTSTALTQKRDNIINANRTEKGSFVIEMGKLRLLYIFFRI